MSWVETSAATARMTNDSYLPREEDEFNCNIKLAIATLV